MSAKKRTPRESTHTQDIYGVIYRKIVGTGNIVYHCSTNALGNPRPNENAWQVIEEDTVTEALSPILNSGGDITYDFDSRINDSDTLTGAGTFLALETYWSG